MLYIHIPIIYSDNPYFDMIHNDCYYMHTIYTVSSKGRASGHAYGWMKAMHASLSDARCIFFFACLQPRPRDSHTVAAYLSQPLPLTRSLVILSASKLIWNVQLGEVQLSTIYIHHPFSHEIVRTYHNSSSHSFLLSPAVIIYKTLLKNTHISARSIYSSSSMSNKRRVGINQELFSSSCKRFILELFTVYTSILQNKSVQLYACCYKPALK